MRRITLFVVVGMLHALPARAQQVDAAFRGDVERFMDLTGFSQQVRQSTAAASKQIIDAMRQAVPDLPERVLQSATTIMNEEFAKAVVAPGGLVAQMAAIYAKHFTAEDLRALVAFYSTPAGQKALKALPLITQEAAGLGKAWGQQILPTIGAAVQARLRNEGLIR